MKIRLTILIERELTEQGAFEHYRTVDPYVVAAEMTREGQDMMKDVERTSANVKLIGVHAEPTFG